MEVVGYVFATVVFVAFLYFLYTRYQAYLERKANKPPFTPGPRPPGDIGR